MDMDPFSNNYKNSCSIFSRSDWVSFCRNTLKNRRVIFKYIMNLLRAYVIASLPFAVVFIIKNNKSETFFRKLLVALLWKGMATHLWYFPATIFALVVCWLIIRITGSVTGKALAYLGWGTNLICSVCDIYSHAFGFECGGTRTYCDQPYTLSPIF